MKKVKIRLVFKSGHVQDVWVETLKVKTNGGRLSEITWTNMRPRPLYISCDDLSAVLVLK